MTNYEKVKSHFQALFGNGLTLTPEICAEIYAQAMEDAPNCEGCILGLALCCHRNGQITFEEAKQRGMSDEELDEWFCDTGRGLTCEQIILEWLNEEADEESSE